MPHGCHATFDVERKPNSRIRRYYHSHKREETPENIRVILEHIDLSNNHDTVEERFVATVGFFDGVHAGHRYLIRQVREEAARQELPSAVITFPVHPRKVLQTDYQPALLCGYEEKLAQLASTGVDYCITLPFSAALSQLTARAFMQQVLQEQLHVSTLLVGYDHRFGYNRLEGYDDYARYGKEIGMSVIRAVEWQTHGGNVSSTRIRKLLKEGDVMRANSLLSYRYTLSGKIVEGYRVGRTIGFPTANIRSWERYKVVPALGVYAVRVHLQGEIYEGMLYIGKRPTLHADPDVSVEVNIFNFSGNLYNLSLTVEFIDFIRPDQKFDTMELLVEQIHKDKKEVQQRLRKERL